jgi:hypothetical protein
VNIYVYDLRRVEHRYLHSGPWLRYVRSADRIDSYVSASFVVRQYSFAFPLVLPPKVAHCRHFDRVWTSPVRRILYQAQSPIKFQ